jgi:hypothetical protein
VTRSLDEAAKFLEVLDKWLNTATARRNSVLKLLEYYCGPTNDRSEVTDAEYKEVEQDKVKQIAAPSLAPAELVAHDGGLDQTEVRHGHGHRRKGLALVCADWCGRHQADQVFFANKVFRIG